MGEEPTEAPSADAAVESDASYPPMRDAEVAGTVDATIPRGDAGSSQPVGRIPPRGSDQTLDIGSWNLEWFGAPNMAPTDDILQRENARDVIDGARLDIWGLTEIVNGDAFTALLGKLPSYEGLLANDARVGQGSKYYAKDEQKLALIYRKDVATLVSARLILTSNVNDFAGRPPLEARFKITAKQRTSELVVIVLHAKALSEASAWTARSAGAKALKTYLDSSHASDEVIVVGDFNDQLLTSITKSKPSPYANFVNDPNYDFPTEELAIAKLGTTVGRSTAIDQHLTTHELYLRYVAQSVEAYRVDSFINDYADTTSDHYPVLSRYDWPPAP